MPPAPPRLVAAQDQRTRGYTWLLALVIAVGLGGSLAISYTLYRTAERQWIARADSSALRLSTILLGWIEESYSPLSGLAGLVENSKKTEPDEFLNAFEGIESRVTTFLLGSAAMLERDANGKWALSISSGDFDYLEKDAKDGFSKLLPAIEFATARPNQFVLAPPVGTVRGKLMSPVLIALAKVRTPTVLVGSLDYTTLQGALTEAPTPKGFYLTLRGKFMAAPDIRTILQIDSPRAVRETLATRAATGGADLDLSLPSRSKPLRPLAPPLPVRLTTLEERFAGRTVHGGHLTEVSDVEACVESPLALAVLSNLKITVGETPQGNPAGDIYGKVLESVGETPGRARICFTSISPELRTWLSALG